FSWSDRREGERPIQLSGFDEPAPVGGYPGPAPRRGGLARAGEVVDEGRAVQRIAHDSGDPSRGPGLAGQSGYHGRSIPLPGQWVQSAQAALYPASVPPGCQSGIRYRLEGPRSPPSLSRPARPDCQNDAWIRLAVPRSPPAAARRPARWAPPRE